MVHKSEDRRTARMEASAHPVGAPFLETMDSAQVTGPLGLWVNDDPKNGFFIAPEQLILIKTLLWLGINSDHHSRILMVLEWEDLGSVSGYDAN